MTGWYVVLLAVLLVISPQSSGSTRPARTKDVSPPVLETSWVASAEHSPAASETNSVQWDGVRGGKSVGEGLAVQRLEAHRPQAGVTRRYVSAQLRLIEAPSEPLREAVKAEHATWRGRGRALKQRPPARTSARRLKRQRPTALVAGLQGSLADSGYYAVTVYLGSPPRRFTLIADTGSSITYVPCASCRHCGRHHQDPAFDPAKSSSAHTVPCRSPDCLTHACSLQDTGSSGANVSGSTTTSTRRRLRAAAHIEGKASAVGHCVYSGSYAESSSTQGILISDFIHFAPPPPPPLLPPGAQAEAQHQSGGSRGRSSDRPQAEGGSEDAGGVRMVLGCELDERGELFLQRADGILGLGRDALSLPSQVLATGALGTADSFSLCFSAPQPLLPQGSCAHHDSLDSSKRWSFWDFLLPGRTSPQAGAASADANTAPDVGSAGELILGEVDELAGTIWTPMAPASAALPYYVVPVLGMHVGGRALDVGPWVWRQGGYRGAMLDSGTTFTYFPTPVFREFKRNVLDAVNLPKVPGPDAHYEDVCFQMPAWKSEGDACNTSGTGGPVGQQLSQEWHQLLDNMFPGVTMTFANGKVLQLRPINYLFQHKGRSGAMCLGVFDNPDGGILVGAIFMRGMRVTFDRNRSRVGFAPHHCRTPAGTEDRRSVPSLPATLPSPQRRPPRAEGWRVSGPLAAQGTREDASLEADEEETAQSRDTGLDPGKELQHGKETTGESNVQGCLRARLSATLPQQLVAPLLWLHGLVRAGLQAFHMHTAHPRRSASESIPRGAGENGAGKQQEQMNEDTTVHVGLPPSQMRHQIFQEWLGLRPPDTFSKAENHLPGSRSQGQQAHLNELQRAQLQHDRAARVVAKALDSLANTLRAQISEATTDEERATLEPGPEGPEDLLLTVAAGVLALPLILALLVRPLVLLQSALRLVRVQCSATSPSKGISSVRTCGSTTLEATPRGQWSPQRISVYRKWLRWPPSS